MDWLALVLGVTKTKPEVIVLPSYENKKCYNGIPLRERIVAVKKEKHAR